MNIPILAQMPEQVATAVLLGLLILAFVVAFKIMKMVMQTLLVSVLSGVFYVSLVILFNYPFSFNELLMFSFLGSSFYMLYTFLASAYGVATKLIGIPYKILVLGLIPFRRAYSELKEFWVSRKDKRKESSDSENRDYSGNSTKEVVLDKVKEKNKE